MPKVSEYIARQLQELETMSSAVGQYATRLYNMYVDTKEYDAKGDGTTDDTQAILNTIAAFTAQSVSGVMAFTMGNQEIDEDLQQGLGGAFVISSDITVPSTIGVFLQDGVTIEIPSGVTMTFNGPVASLRAYEDVFTGSGTYVINTSDRISVNATDIGNVIQDAGTPISTSIASQQITFTASTTSFEKWTLDIASEISGGPITIVKDSNPSKPLELYDGTAVVSLPAGYVTVVEEASEFVLVSAPLADSLIDQAYVELRASVSQSISNGVKTDVIWDTVIKDNRNHFNPSNPSYITIREEGKYLIVSNIDFESNVNGYRTVYIDENSTEVAIITQPPVNGTATRMVISEIKDLDVGDEIYIAAFQNSGVTLNIQASGVRTNTLSVAKLA